MAAYKLLFKRPVTRDLRSIPKKDLEKNFGRIKALAVEPRTQGCEKLSVREYYRIRQGDYRIVYAINDTEVCVMVIRVAHRKEAYRK